MSYEREVAGLMREIVETGMIVRDRVNCLKNGLETIAKHGHKFQSCEEVIEIAKSTLDKYEKMP